MLSTYRPISTKTAPFWLGSAICKAMRPGVYRARPHRYNSSMASKRPRVNVVLDFDGTITTSDTTAVIGSRCLAKARELARADVPASKLPKAMEYYTEQYFQEYEEWRQSGEWPEENRKTIADEVAYLSKSRHVEQNSFLRVRNAVLHVPGAIGEMERDERLRNDFMLDTGRQAVRSGQVRIRDLEELKKLVASLDNWAIVSVSWSRRFILGVLLESGLVGEIEAEDMVNWIWCNELLDPNFCEAEMGPAVNDENGFNHGEDKHPIMCSARDKEEAFSRLLRQWEKQAELQFKESLGYEQYPVHERTNDAIITLYVGDSTTDLGCLASGAAIGMYLCLKNPADDTVVQTLKRLEIEHMPASSFPTGTTAKDLLDKIDKVSMQNPSAVRGLVYLIQGFQDVNEWIAKLGKC